jgi:ketosteroid isomerase-like protein
MAAEKNKAIDEAQIRELIDNWAKALRAKDINELMSHYTPDILVFDLAPPLQYKGTDAYRKNFEEWFPSFQGPVGYEIRDLRITTGDDVAFSHSLNRISGARTSAEKAISGCARPLASVRVTANGGSRMSMSRCLSTWSPHSKRRLTSSRNPSDRVVDVRRSR